MLAYFGTDVDWGKGTVGVDVDGVEGVGAERSDKKGGLNLLKINPPCNGAKDVGINEFFAGVPNMAVLLVNDGVLVRVVVVGNKARWDGKEVGEGKEVGGKRGEEGGWRWWSRGGNSGNGGFNDGQGNVLNRDIFKIDDFTWELKLRPIVLSEWGEETVEFCLCEVDDMGGGLFTKLFKVELGRGAKGFKGGLRGRRGQGSDDVGVGVDWAGLEGVWVDKGNARVGRQGGIDGGLDGGKERKTRNNELRAGSNSG